MLMWAIAGDILTLNLLLRHVTLPSTDILHTVLLFLTYEQRHVISNIVAFWQVYTQTSLCSPLLSLEASNGVQYIV